MSSQNIKHIDLTRGVGNVTLKATRPSPYQTDASSFINTSNKPLPIYRFTTDDSITMDNRAGHLQAGLVGLLTEGGDSLVTEDGFNILME
jgi:hypothetical protein